MKIPDMETMKDLEKSKSYSDIMCGLLDLPSFLCELDVSEPDGKEPSESTRILLHSASFLWLLQKGHLFY